MRGLPENEFGPYVINGERAKPGAWPWHVQIFINGDDKCGGSLLDHEWVLTAAHCIKLVTNNLAFVKISKVIKIS